MKALRLCEIALLSMLISSGIAVCQEPFAPGTWKPIVHPLPTTGGKPTAAGHAMLLTDGSVLVMASTCNATGNWYRLVPDKTGSYLNGTWTGAGFLEGGYNPLYFASQVLPTGQVVIMGGEYNGCTAVWSTLGSLYNPKSNKWAPLIAPAGWSTVGDAQSIVLPNGKMMLANCCTAQEVILTLTGGIASWAPTGTGKVDANDEEGWTMLPGGKILTVNAYTSGGCCAKGFQIYNPSTGAWTTPAGNTVVNLVDPSTSEIGPLSLLPNGTVFAGGGTTNNAIYNVSTGKWAKAPGFGSKLDMADAPAAVLPDGNLLLDTSPGFNQNGSVFFEWDGTALHRTSNPTNAPIDPSFVGEMVVLPTGQILFTAQSASVEIYTPVGGPCSGCAPTITSVASTLTHGSLNNAIHGTQFTGVTQGVYYGDDSQSFSNFPLVRITDSAQHVVYCRTHNWAPSVATGKTLVGAQFDVPSTIALGAATLQVVVNGIPSKSVNVTID